MRIDHIRFFVAYRRQFGPLREEQVEPLDLLVGFINNDNTLTDYRHAAYMLATVRGECGDTYEPVEEGFYLETRADRFRQRLRYAPWWGRGYVQLTWKANYKRASQKLGVDFIADPAKVMKPEYAYQIMTRGMQNGWFTGKSLYDYINGHRCDYRNARRIINGTDKAAKFAGWARQFDAILSYAEVRK